MHVFKAFTKYLSKRDSHGLVKAYSDFFTLDIKQVLTQEQFTLYQAGGTYRLGYPGTCLRYLPE